MSYRNHGADEAWRLFIAIELPPDVRHRVKLHIERLRKEVCDVRASWTREQNLHLTMKFFGDTPVEKTDHLARVLKTAADQIPAFEMQIAGCGAFPSRGKPNVLWIGITRSHRLEQLHRTIENQCAQAGVERDPRSLHPHLTIARLRQSDGARQLAQRHQEIGFDPLTVSVKDVCLIRSELSSAGSLYTTIARHKLAF